MSDETKDYSKLKSFVEAAITNPRHPVYQLGMQRSQILQHYALNVKSTAFSGGLAVMESEQWFKDYPQWTQKLTEVMALCEAEPVQEAMTDTKATERIAALEAQVADLTAKLAEAKPAEQSES